MENLLVLFTAFVLGAVHAFDADHIAAVTAFVNKNQKAKNAALFGLKWGLGHALSLSFIGAALLALRFRLPDRFVSSAEFIVGIVLVALGVWVIAELVQKRIHRHSHTHGVFSHVHWHSHARSEVHEHGHVVTLVGALHGLAGTASVLVLIPITLMVSIPLAIFYVVIFSLGTMLAMAAYAVGLNEFFRTVANNSEHIYYGMRGFVAIFNISLGVYFMIGI